MRQAMKDLKQDTEIVILPADKGNATVVMDHSEYMSMSEFEKRGNFTQNAIFLPLFNQPPFQANKSPSVQTWFASSLGLLHHRSNVRS